MFNMNRLMGGMKLSAAVFVVGVAGCGADPANTPGTGQTPILTAGTGSSLPNSTLGAAGTGSPTLPKAGTGSTAVVPPTGAAGVAAVAAAAGTSALPVAGSSAGTAAVVGAAGAAPGAAGSGSATPGTDTWTPMSNLDASGNLIVPAAGQGYQMETKTFDLQPGQEIFSCYHAAAPNDATLPVGEWDGQMTAGSHHFILYRSDSDTTPDGTLVNSGCTMGFGGSAWLYTQGTPRSHLLMPDGVAMELTPHERIVFDMHYINTGTEVIHAHIILNLNRVKTEKWQVAGSQVSFNVGINVPAHGKQTVGGDCTPVVGANYFIMQTHTHKHATLAVVNRSKGGVLGEELVKTTDWDNPQAHEWHSAPFLNFASGETFHYSCSFVNDSSQAVTVGTSAAVNEMCMAEAYYFPANGRPGACN
jgi:hypothetical protein